MEDNYNCRSELNFLHDAINFLNYCDQTDSFPIGHCSFYEAIISIRESTYYSAAPPSEKMKTIMNELNKMTMKDKHKLLQFIKDLNDKQEEILEAFANKRIKDYGKFPIMMRGEMS